MPADPGELACLAALDDVDHIIQDEIVLKRGVTEAASLSYSLFDDCSSPTNCQLSSTAAVPTLCSLVT